VLRATDLLRAGNDFALRAASASPALPLGAAPTRDRTLFAGTGNDPLGHARTALAQDLREGMRSTMVREAPGVRTYLWGVRRRMNEAWRPGVVRVPNLAETLAASFGVNSRQVEAMGRWWRERQTAMTAERDRGGAIDAIESIGGTTGRGSEGLSRMPNDSLNEAWRRNTRITRAEVRVDQSPEGRVLDVRVVRSSGAAAFDRAALEAVRQGLDAQDPIPLPGGRRSVWSFTVVATRRLIAANIGGAFDESRGWFQVQLPGSVSMRSRVFMESSEPMPTDG
jgi:TonB family protein